MQNFTTYQRLLALVLLLPFPLLAQLEDDWTISAQLGPTGLSAEIENLPRDIVLVGEGELPAFELGDFIPMSGFQYTLQVRHSPATALLLSGALTAVGASSRYWDFGELEVPGAFSSRNIGGVANHTSLGVQLGVHARALRLRNYFSWHFGALLGFHRFRLAYTETVGIRQVGRERYDFLGGTGGSTSGGLIEPAPTTRITIRPLRFLGINLDATAGIMGQRNTAFPVYYAYWALQAGIFVEFGPRTRRGAPPE